MTFKRQHPQIDDMIEKLIDAAKREAIYRLVLSAHPTGDHARQSRKAQTVVSSARRQLHKLIRKAVP